MMSRHPLCGSYFRPWSPGDDDQSVRLFSDSLSKESPVLDLSKKRTQRKGPSSGAQTSMKPSPDSPVPKCGRETKQEMAPSNNSYCLPNPLLLQQLQMYYNYHLMRSLPLLHNSPQGGLVTEDHILQWQKGRLCVSPETLPANRPPISNLSATAASLNIDAVNDVPFMQRRGILNVPSPSFTHNPAALSDDSWESKYPLPSAKDGEPLDLLPKSLYMNKAHGGHLCIFCGKLYSRKYGLKIHLRTHTGYKPLKCKVCQRPFGDPSNLNKHIRLHAEGETPYRCDQCGKVLVRRRDLERHIRSRHPSEADKIIHLDSPTSSDDGLNSSFEAESMEELDVVGLQQ